MKDSIRHRCIVYDNSKETDILTYRDPYRNLKGFIVNNWTPTNRRVVDLLHTVGVKSVYFKINMYDRTLSQIELDICLAKELGFDGIAIDGEAYSDSDIWQEHEGVENSYYNTLGWNIHRIATNSGLELILLPEYLGGEKYEKYEGFMKGLEPNKILMERTYNEWYPWKILQFWIRNMKYKGEKCIGIWPDSIDRTPAFIQLQMAKMLSKTIFYYTEEKIH